MRDFLTPAAGPSDIWGREATEHRDALTPIASALRHPAHAQATPACALRIFRFGGARLAEVGRDLSERLERDPCGDVELRHVSCRRGLFEERDERLTFSDRDGGGECLEHVIP